MRTFKQYELKKKIKEKNFEQWDNSGRELNPGPPAYEAKEFPLGHGVFSVRRCIMRRTV